jgi:hypothetical protein
MADEPTARASRGNPRPTRATRAPRRPHPDPGEIILVVSTSRQNTTPLDTLAVHALRESLAMRMRLP